MTDENQNIQNNEKKEEKDNINKIWLYLMLIFLLFAIFINIFNLSSLDCTNFKYMVTLIDCNASLVDDTMYNSDTLSTRHECTKDVFTSSLSFNDWKLYFQNCEWWKIGFYGSPDCTWHDSDGNDYVFDGAKITWSFEQ